MMSGISNRSAVLPHLKAHPMAITTSPVPDPQGNEVLIRVRAVAINPADWAVQTLGVVIKPEFYPYVSGVDVSGDIISVGPSQTRFKPGDRVVATAMAYLLGETKYGAFQEHMIGVEPLLAKIPDRVHYHEAAVLPLALTTAATILFSPELLGLEEPRLGIPSNSRGKLVFVWGGSSSVGSNAIQTVKAAGYVVATTASANNHELVKQMGVDYVFDRNKVDVVDDIVATFNGKLDLAGIFCAILSESSIVQCAEIASQLEGKRVVGTVMPPGMPVPTSVPAGVEICINQAIRLNQTATGRAIWVDWLTDALEEGSLKCMPPPDVIGTGLEKIQDGVDAIGTGVSGKKLVVKL